MFHPGCHQFSRLTRLKSMPHALWLFKSAIRNPKFSNAPWSLQVIQVFSKRLGLN
jgi:hypothetical protein